MKFVPVLKTHLSGSQVLEKINNPHYLYRMTILQAISLLAPVMGAEITCQNLLPVVINSSKDR
jgi:serine/threonine-protein phosphatase 2A regulatory subunit A